MKLKNQPLAKEGKLPYMQKNGRVIYKIKRWKDLKTFIGKRVPIVDEHPINAKGELDFIDTNTKIYGYGTVKQCLN